MPTATGQGGSVPGPPQSPPSKTPLDEAHFRLMRLIEAHPQASQRELANAMGVSVGKVNYCLRALVDRGWVKVNNFRRNPNKLSYAYLLTPSGVREKALITSRFLERKVKEYERLRREIAELQREVGEIPRSV